MAKSSRRTRCAYFGCFAPLLSVIFGPCFSPPCDGDIDEEIAPASPVYSPPMTPPMVMTTAMNDVLEVSHPVVETTTTTTTNSSVRPAATPPSPISNDTEFIPRHLPASPYDALASILLRLADCSPQSIDSTLALCSASADRVASTAAFINVSLAFIENTSGFFAFIPNIGNLDTLDLAFKRQCFLLTPAQQVKPRARAAAALALTASADSSKFDDLAPTSLPKGTLPRAPYFVKLRRTRPPGLCKGRNIGDITEAYARYEEELDAVFLEDDNQLSPNVGNFDEYAEPVEYAELVDVSASPKKDERVSVFYRLGPLSPAGYILNTTTTTTTATDIDSAPAAPSPATRKPTRRAGRKHRGRKRASA